jgi:hypothetical protein
MPFVLGGAKIYAPLVTLSITAADGLAGTLARLDAGSEWLQVRSGLPRDAVGWTVAADVDEAFVRAWERAVAHRHDVTYGRSDPVTAAGYVLSWYASVPARIAGACFAVARRVPRLEPEVVALHRHPEDLHPDGVALLDDRFWCLPDDPAAGDPAATVAADEAALGAVLRAQVRAHADRFLGWYTPGARLPRRSLLGAFFDGLDVGLWTGGLTAGVPAACVPEAATPALPGGTAEFRDASTLYLLRDARGREHLTRERVACCHYYRIEPTRDACFTCPRTTPAARRALAAEWPDEEC